jgi:beta-fructofuranosidase
MKTALHFTPVRGWLNDPNGLIEHRGVHHLFFQHNPEELAMKNMTWGHASTTDLITWTEHPIALRPGGPGTYDGDGCWSGCAVDTGDGVVIVYSGNNGGIQLPCLATALDDDLVGWQKSPANPVIGRRPPVPGISEMRDHSVRRTGDRWHQVLAAGAGGRGLLVGYSSSDLIHWSWDGIVLSAVDADLPGEIFECPDVFETSGQAVAIISLIDGEHRPGPVIWVTGQFDASRIVPERWGIVDHGNRFYAPQSYIDAAGRRIMFGWLVTQQDPAARGRDSIGAASLPRIVSVVDGRLHQEPAAEVRAWRGDALTPVAESRGCTRIDLVAAPALEVSVSCESTADLLAVAVEFEDLDGNCMSVTFEGFGSAHVLRDGRWEADDTEPTAATVIFDSGLVEVFLDDGRAASWTDARLEVVERVRVHCWGGVPLAVTVWPLSP